LAPHFVVAVKPTTLRSNSLARRERPQHTRRPGISRPADRFGAFFDCPDGSLIDLTLPTGILAPMHPGYCPDCGERVTPYAAGCALCGADLDPKRWQKPVSARQKLSIRMPASLRRAIGGRRVARVRGSL